MVTGDCHADHNIIFIVCMKLHQNVGQRLNVRKLWSLPLIDFVLTVLRWLFRCSCSYGCRFCIVIMHVVLWFCVSLCVVLSFSSFGGFGWLLCWLWSFLSNRIKHFPKQLFPNSLISRTKMIFKWAARETYLRCCQTSKDTNQIVRLYSLTGATHICSLDSLGSIKASYRHRRIRPYCVNAIFDKAYVLSATTWKNSSK